MADPIVELTRLYTNPSRKYHNLKHITSMLMGTPEPLTNNQIMAIWFHDAIYNPMSTSNEEDSVDLISKLYNTDGLDAEGVDITIVGKIIMSTQQHQPLCDEAKLVLDLDLAILGSPSHVYDEYVKNVTAEYTEHIPAHMFHPGRAAFLRKFLQRDSFFFTEWGKATFETAARINLKNELSKYDRRLGEDYEVE